jgi:hypothetical protein
MVTYSLSIKPTESQLEFFLGKHGIPLPDYWSLIGKNPNHLLVQRANKALTSLYSFLVDELHKQFNRLSVSVLKYDLNLPLLLFLVDIPDNNTLQQIKSLPEVRKVVESKKFVPTQDEPEIPENMKNKLRRMNSFKL